MQQHSKNIWATEVVADICLIQMNHLKKFSLIEIYGSNCAFSCFYNGMSYVVSRFPLCRNAEEKRSHILFRKRAMHSNYNLS